MKITLDELVSRFQIQKHEAGMFFLMLTMLPPGGVFEAVNGRIEKVDEETLKLVIDEKTFALASNDFIDESVSSYDEMFGHLPLS
jgi:hypothetical protein